MSKEEVIQNLVNVKLSDGVYNTVRKDFPVAEKCPTCAGRGKYTLDFDTYDCDCSYQVLLQKHYFAANIGREYHDICLDDFIGDDTDAVVPVVKDYLAHYEDNYHYGLGLTFNGPVGTGKSFSMACILKELIKQGVNVYFVTFEELINIWGSSWHNEESKQRLQNTLKRATVLGIDEVRTDGRNHSGFLASGFDSIIRHRTSNLLPTLVTTNMSRDDEFAEFSKVYSLLSARNTRITTTGHDKRMREIRERTNELKTRGERRPIC